MEVLREQLYCRTPETVSDSQRLASMEYKSLPLKRRLSLGPALGSSFKSVGAPGIRSEIESLLTIRL